MVSDHVPGEVALLLGLFANSPNFIGLAGLDQKGIFLNRAGRSLVRLKSKRRSINGRSWSSFPKEDRPYIASVAIPRLLKEGTWNGEVRFKHFTTGEYIPMMWRAFVVPNLDTPEELKNTQQHHDELLHHLQGERTRLLKTQGELQERLRELENFEDVVVGRELKMLALEKDSHDSRKPSQVTRRATDEHARLHHTAHCARIRRAIIDKDVTIPPKTEIGYDLEADKRRFTVTDFGIITISKGTKLSD